MVRWASAKLVNHCSSRHSSRSLPLKRTSTQRCAWLAERPRDHTHLTPTDASWLNQVERWFGLVTQRAIRRASVRTTGELVRRIEAFVAAYNATARPFAWTATSESILAKLERLLEAMSGSQHSGACENTAVR